MRAAGTLLLYLALVLAPVAPEEPLRVSVAAADDDDGGDDDSGDDDSGDDDGGGGGGDDDDSGGDDDRGGDFGDRAPRNDEVKDRDGNDETVGERFLRDLTALFGADEDGRDRDIAPNEIVGLDLTEAARAELVSAGFRVLSTRTLSGLGTTLNRLAVPDRLSEAEGLALARRTAPAAEFDFNHLYGGSSCSDPSCWPLQAIAAAPLAADACARGAPVAIVDTAVDLRHPALRGARIETRGFLDADQAPAPPAHGTAVAALLVGRAGRGADPLAPGATLLAAEAFALRGERQRADSAAIVAALDWALTRRARVIGMSLAGGANALVERAVRAVARRANILAAAGNDGPRAAPAYPAAYAEVAAVAAVDVRRRAWRGGNRGDYVEFAAPGVGVVSAAAGGGVAEWTGTSFAVPYAMAAAIRARAATGGDPVAARRLMARQAQDLGAPGRDAVFGHGLIRAQGGRCW